MPTIQENEERWGEAEWNDGGEAWSDAWGGSASLWWRTFHARLFPYLPADSILEIAPGYGRFTAYLLPLCRRLVGVDLVERCVEHCRRRFAGREGAEFHRGDGTSLPMVADGSVDFALSIDSLVHAEADVLEAYVGELARVLRPDGVAFLHHSTLGDHVDPETGEPPFENVHWRARSMRAELFRDHCRAAGLVCTGQEIVTWGSPHLTDCFSLATRPGSRFAHDYRRWENPHFMEEAAYHLEQTRLYRPGKES